MEGSAGEIDGLFEIDAKKRVITSHKRESECYCEITYGDLKFTRKIVSATPLKAMIPKGYNSNNKMILPVG